MKHELDQSIRQFYKDIIKISLKNPKLFLFALKTFFYQKKAAQKRKYWLMQNLNVPPFLIASITGKCNLACSGCYSHAQNRASEEELDLKKIKDIFSEAYELGISNIFLAGGEPLVRKDVLNIAKEFTETIFPLFTNGILLDEKLIMQIRHNRNIIPVISIEGYKENTDSRRGIGVHDTIITVMENLKKNNILFGVSITITRKNISSVIKEDFIQYYLKLGAKVFFFVEYVPMDENSQNMVLSINERKEILDKTNEFHEKYPALFVSFPGDEEKFGGCLSAGRGFIHISAGGNLEPCPMAPFSDTSLKNLSLKEGLKSAFLEKIRNNQDKLKDLSGGCAIFSKREWVNSLLVNKSD